MKKSTNIFKNNDIINSVFSDRERTNILRKQEQTALSWLVQRIPPFISSNMLTAIGFCGYVIVFVSFILAHFFSPNYLLLGIPGFLINWFGDSLDGRLAYYRNKPRKNFGFALDVTIDWLSIILIGFGYIIYADGAEELMGYTFVVLYGWEIIVAMLRFKITGKYSIDSGLIGPTEVRILISAILVAEVLLPNSLKYSVGIAIIILLLVNITDTRKLLHLADDMDRKGPN